jgi:hypothetical protein
MIQFLNPWFVDMETSYTTGNKGRLYDQFNYSDLVNNGFDISQIKTRLDITRRSICCSCRYRVFYSLHNV